MRRLWINFFAILAQTIVVPLLLATSTHAQDMAIGVAGPMTGSEATFGRQMRNGVEQAVADINAAGGVLGRRVTLEIGDDACDPKQARSVAERLAAKKVPFVVGHYCSSSSIPASEAYAEGGVLQISPASTNPLFTERRFGNVFRVTGRDDQQGLVVADYIARNFNGKNVAILHDKTVYGKGLADQTKRTLNAAGVVEKQFDAINKGDKDFSSIVARFKRDNIDVVFLGSYHQEAALLLRQMRDAGLRTVLISGDAIADREFFAVAGPAAEGTLFTFGPDPRKRPTAKAAIQKFQSRGINPEGYTLYAYAAVQVWAQAVAKIGSTDARRVAERLKGGDWNTVLGELSFDSKGDIRHIDYVIYRWDARGGYAEISPGAGRIEIAAPPPPLYNPVDSKPAPLTQTMPSVVTAPASPALPPATAIPAPAPPPIASNIPTQKPPTANVAPIDQGRRVALVIGNSTYKNVGVLPNPQRDAASIALALKKIGFQSVTLQTDLDKEKLVGALQTFADIAETADWSLVYFAGHGMEIGGINYLIPIDARLSTDRDVAFQAVPLDFVLNAAERAKKLRLVILDACRDNPFAERMKRTMTVASRSVVRGLARIEPDPGTIVVYAAKHGETALDGAGISNANSPFATAFVKNIQTPGLEVRLLFDTVRDDVMELTNNEQKPFIYGSISARQQFYFLAAK
jgi:branched-chain amino acid transport system substrate-binding protein